MWGGVRWPQTPNTDNPKAIRTCEKHHCCHEIFHALAFSEIVIKWRLWQHLLTFHSSEYSRSAAR